MPNILLTEDQLDIINCDLNKQKVIKEIHEKWESINKTQKLFVLEYLKALHPHKEKQFNEVIEKVKNNQLNEAWYNTVLDIVGWLDPTGIADALNGVIYLRQGDYLFGFLSFVSAIPYAGDIVAKPVMYALKAGKPSAKALNGVMKLSKAGKTTDAAAELTKLSSSGGLVGWFTKQMGKLAPKLEQLVNSMPGGVLKGFKNTLLEWIQLFKNAGKTGTIAKQITKNSADLLPRLSQAEQIKNIKELKDAMATLKGPFSSYRTTRGVFSWKTFWGGAPQLMGRNKSVRALMRKTKWYLGLLDFLGIANFVGPDELQAKLGNAKFEENIESYNKTAKSQEYAKDDFGVEPYGGEETTTNNQTSQTSQSSSKEKSNSDPLSWLLGLS